MGFEYLGGKRKNNNREYFVDVKFVEETTCQSSDPCLEKRYDRVVRFRLGPRENCNALIKGFFFLKIKNKKLKDSCQLQ